MSKKYTYEDIKIFVESLNYELISKEYINNKQKLIIKDIEGYYYTIVLFALQKNVVPSIFHTSNPYTIQNIKLWCKLNKKPFELISDEYKGNDIKMKWQCLKENCGEVFENNWNDIVNNQGCAVCAGRQVGLSNCLAIKNPELASEWHPTKNDDLTPYDITCGSNQYVWWKCSKNPKHEWYADINSRNKNGCPYCRGLYASEDYNLLIINPKLCEEWDYEKNKKNPENYTPGSNDHVYWICNECKHKWKAQINSRNGSGNGCPECRKSKGEKEIDKVLIENNWIKISQKDFDNLIDNDKYSKLYFIPQKEFEGLVGVGRKNLSYDFYIPKLNLLIEYQGEQHEKFIKGIHGNKKKFLRQLEHDRRKKEYAKINNINFIEIWYYDFDRIEEILYNYIF